MAKQVTLDDVARLSGVSTATASRAINGRPGVRDDVRERVRLIADSLGFRPNRAAQHLAGGRSGVIGLVIPTADLRIDPYGASVTHAVGRAANAADQGLMLHLAADEPGGHVQRILRDGLIDGALVSAIGIGTAWIDELLASDLPTLLIGTHPSRRDVDAVDVENFESSVVAVEHLFEQGCARVGFIAGLLGRADARERLRGYRTAHERHGRLIDERLIAAGDFRRGSGSRCARELIEVGVDGIFASNDDMALGALWAMAHLGVRVPDDVAVVGFDGTSADEFLEISLTSVVQPFDAIADAAVHQLLTRVADGPRAGLVLLPPELRIGGSSRRRAA
ncbi:MAG: LacI family DNA-binding transcriptional regulator [Acidimicrobiia bacterium]